jgi:sensor histidine kinase YesM
MAEEQRSRQLWLEAAIIFGAWTVFGLVLAHQIHMQSLVRDDPLAMSIVIRLAALEAYQWAVATLAIFWLARRLSLERGRVLQRIAIHLLAAVTLWLARSAFVFGLSRQVDWLRVRSFTRQLWATSSQTFLYYALLVGIAHAVLYYARYRERERAAERLAAGLTEARLQALKMQLQPHFLFNTLNAISALIPADAKPARRMVARLGDLLRISLEHEETQEVTLREELAFLEPYLEIEQARLENRLTVVMNIAPDTLDARVPHLILQPLVENAIRHGIAPRIEPGTVEISSASGDGGRVLHLQVRDDGSGVDLDKRDTTRKGVGLTNIQSRLEQLYQGNHSFALENHRGGGVVVKISFPLRRGAE